MFLLLAVLSMFTGLILETLTVNQRKLYEMHLNDLALIDRHKSNKSKHAKQLPATKHPSPATVDAPAKKQP